MNCCVLKFLRRIVDRKYMVCETPTFKFPQHSVMGPQPSAVYYRLSRTAFRYPCEFYATYNGVVQVYFHI